MAEKIIVGLKSHNHAEQLASYLQETAKPGTDVLFLLPYPLERKSYLRDYLVNTESRTAAVKAGRRLAVKYCWERQRKLAERLIAPVLARMRSKGIDAGVRLYGGSLRRAMREHQSDATVHWIVTETLAAGWLGYFRAKAGTSLSWSNYMLSVRNLDLADAARQSLCQQFWLRHAC